MKKGFENMLTIVGKCSFNPFFYFMNKNVDNVLSSSTFLSTRTTTISTNLKYSRNEFVNIHEHDKICHIWLKGFNSNGGSMATIALKFILHFKNVTL